MNRILYIAILITVVFACHKDSDITIVTSSGPIPTVKVESSITGRVVDESGTPLVGATVAISDNQLITNDKGLFFLSKKLLNKNGEHVRVTKDGYLGNSKFSFQDLSNSSFVEVVLTQKQLSSKYLSTESKTITLSGNAQVEFTANSIVDGNGQAYKGTVLVYSRYFDPTDNTSINLMPGDLRAEDIDGNSKLLESFGSVQVELEDLNGAKLNIAPGKTAKLIIPVATSKLATAPSTIKLWHFNESNGYWKEEAQASLTDGKYIGDVSHFSFWNAGAGTGFVRLSGTVVDQNNNTLSGIKVKVGSNNNGNATGYTNSVGVFSGFVPNKDQLSLSIYDNCGNQLASKSLGYLTTDTDLGKLSESIANDQTITGTLVDCSNQKLQVGIVYFYDNNSTLIGTATTNNDGNFQFTFSNCNNWGSVNVTGYNYVIPQMSTPISINLNSQNTSLPSAITVCDGTDETLSIKINNNDTFYMATNLSLTLASNVYTLTGGDGLNNTINMQFTKNANDYTMSKLSVLLNGPVMSANSSALDCTFCGTCGCTQKQMVFTQFGQNPGEYCIGSLIGVESSNGGNINYVINFKVKRDN